MHGQNHCEANLIIGLEIVVLDIQARLHKGTESPSHCLRRYFTSSVNWPDLEKGGDQDFGLEVYPTNTPRLQSIKQYRYR